MSWLLCLFSTLQTRSADLDKIKPHQFAFNPVTLIDREESGWVGSFTPDERDKNWFAEDIEHEALKIYFMLDLRQSKNRQMFAEFDGFGNK